MNNNFNYILYFFTFRPLVIYRRIRRLWKYGFDHSCIALWLRAKIDQLFANHFGHFALWKNPQLFFPVIGPSKMRQLLLLNSIFFNFISFRQFYHPKPPQVGPFDLAPQQFSLPCINPNEMWLPDWHESWFLLPVYGWKVYPNQLQWIFH